MRTPRLALVFSVIWLAQSVASLSHAVESEGATAIRKVVRPYALVFSDGLDSDADKFAMRVDLSMKNDEGGIFSTTVLIERDGDRFAALFIKDELPFLWVGPGLTVALDRVATGGLVILTGGSIELTLPDPTEKKQLTWNVAFSGKLGESKLVVDLRTILDFAVHRAKEVAFDRATNTVKMTNETGTVVEAKMVPKPELGVCPVEYIAMGLPTPDSVRISGITTGAAPIGLASLNVEKVLKLDLPVKAGRLSAEAITLHCEMQAPKLFDDEKAKTASKKFAALFSLPGNKTVKERMD